MIAAGLRARSVRPVWLTTLADLALLLVGFFALLQATRPADRPALADAIRTGFDPATPRIAMERGAVTGFAPGSAALPESTAAAIAWARTAARDPRTLIELAGATAGAADVDPATGSGPVLAADRARAVAAALVRAGAVGPNRLALVTAPGAPAGAVQLRLVYAGAAAPLR